MGVLETLNIEKLTPEKCALEPLPILLPARVPRPGDCDEPTVEDFEGDIAAWSAELVRLGKPHARVCSWMTAHGETYNAHCVTHDPRTTRGSVPCPSCEKAHFVMSMHAELDCGVRGKCLGACTREMLGAALVRAVPAWEQERLSEARDTVLDRMRDEQLSSVDTSAEWIVRGLVPDRALTLLVAKSGHRKNWIAQSLGVCAAAGVPFLGREVRRGRVLFVILESKKINVGRLESIAAGLGITNFEELRREWLHVYPHALKSDDAGSMATFATWVRAFGYSLVVIDNATEVRSTRSQSAENDSTIISAALIPLARLAQEGTINGERVAERPPALVVLHHAGADGSLRGSTAFLQHADYVLEARAKNPKDPESAVSIALGEGSRLVGDGLPTELRFRGFVPGPVTAVLAEREAAPESKVANTAKPREKLLAVIRSMAPAKWTPIRDAFGGDPARAAELRDELAADGTIEKRDGLWVVVEE